METFRPELDRAWDAIGGWGNLNYLQNYTAHFERLVPEEIAECARFKGTSCRPLCPNFAAWIRFSVETICARTIIDLNRAKGCIDKIAGYNYAPAITEIIHILQRQNKDVDQEALHALKLVIETRHCLQHGGLPNPLRQFEQDIRDEEVRKLVDPMNFTDSKVVFEAAGKFLDLLPKPTILIGNWGALGLPESGPGLDKKPGKNE